MLLLSIVRMIKTRISSQLLIVCMLRKLNTMTAIYEQLATDSCFYQKNKIYCFCK